jgi:hypothetical protein
MDTTSIIVTETKSGSAFVKSAFICNDENDFIDRIQKTAYRSGEFIETIEGAIQYLNEKHAQETRIVNKQDFDSLTTDSWDKTVLEQAKFLGWY